MVSFGFEQEQHDFERRNPEFIRRFHKVAELIPLAFPHMSLTKPADKTIYMLARTCVEDFNEILLLCGNGYGIGAEKMIRGMYERAVTLVYLHQHPECAEDFLDYHKVADHKLLKAVEETMGTDVFSPEEKQRIEREFQEVREQFMVTDCKKCGTKRLNHTWSQLDFVSMAHTTGELGMLLVPAYYLGVREGHSTVGAIFSRLDASAASAGEGLIFGGESQPKRGDNAILLALHILLIALDTQREHFKLDAMNQILDQCQEDLVKMLQSKRSHASAS
jgi:hypothetical protein